MRKKSRIRKTARPSNLPGEKHGRPAVIGLCAKCGAKGHLCKSLCSKCYSKKWRAEGPGGGRYVRPRRDSPAWISDWLKHQAENYLRENARHFDRNGFRLWAMTEDQVIELCRIIYMAKRHHNDKRGYQPGDNYARRDRHREGEGDGSYLDKPISPELRGLK